MNPKVEYIARLFQKTSYKALENYCLTRLWHKLDNNEVKLVPQQYVNRHTDRYALTDVYLPQFKIHIEVNEPAHYNSKERILDDEIRKVEIENKTGHRLFVIDCRKNLEEVHHEIDSIVDLIKEEIVLQKQNKTFKPWLPDIEQNPIYWKEKQQICETDDISLRSIEDICTLFDADFNKTKRGFFRLGGIPYPKGKPYTIWWPSKESRKGWKNTFKNNEEMIVESNTDILKKVNHFNKFINTTEVRIVFFHDEDVLGNVGYKFKGVYEIDKEHSTAEEGLIWKRVRTTFQIE